MLYLDGKRSFLFIYIILTSIGKHFLPDILRNFIKKLLPKKNKIGCNTKADVSSLRSRVTSSTEREAWVGVVGLIQVSHEMSWDRIPLDQIFITKDPQILVLLRIIERHKLLVSLAS